MIIIIIIICPSIILTPDESNIKKKKTFLLKIENLSEFPFKYLIRIPWHLISRALKDHITLSLEIMYRRLFDCRGLLEGGPGYEPLE